MKLIIHGDPLAKARAKALRVGNKSWKYDPQKNEAQSLSWKIKHQANCLPLFGPIVIELRFYFKPCDSDSISQRNAKLHGLEEHTQKPDLDNLEKFVLDCSNKILFEDDSQIVSLTSSKFWSENPRTEINIMRKEDMDIDEIDKKIINLFSPKEIEEIFQDAKILFILAENRREPYQADSREWLKQSAANLKMFAEKYSAKLNKIKNMIKKEAVE